MSKKIITGILIITMILSLAGCGTSKMYASGKEGYTQITFVDGISFEVVSSVARNATAITNMSSDMAYETNQTYLYKDGESAYFIFNMESLVCIAQKGTTFHFSESADMKDSLENNGNILGIWFDCPKRKVSSRDENKNGVYKCIIDANAQVSLTPDIYSDFSGQLATIEYQGDEWALYIGTKGDEGFDKLDKDMKKTIGYMIQSMNIYQATEEQEEFTPPVSLGGEGEVSGNTIKEETGIPEPTTTSELIQSDIAEAQVEETEPSASPDKMDVNEDLSEEIDITLEEAESPSAIPTDPVLETDEETTMEPLPTDNNILSVEPENETIEVVEIEEEPIPSPTPMVRPEETAYVQQNNQKQIKYEDNTVYVTDIYSMLQIGKKGRISMLNNGSASEGIVKVSEVLTGNDAIKLIKQKCNDGTLNYNYFDAPNGCSWNAVHYFIEEGTGYVNVKLRGLDGENLRFRGIEYSQRSYDIKVTDTEFYSYYAVPNACPEYALEIGEGTINNQLLSSYYHIRD